MFISRSYNKTIRININADYFDFETNTRKTLKPKFDANGVDDAGQLWGRGLIPCHLATACSQVVAKYLPIPQQ